MRRPLMRIWWHHRATVAELPEQNRAITIGCRERIGIRANCDVVDAPLPASER